MPCLDKNASKAFEVYSPLLSDRRTLTLWLVWVSTMAFHSSNLFNTWSLDLRMYTHIFLEKSSIKVTKYFAPHCVEVHIQPRCNQLAHRKEVCVQLGHIEDIMDANPLHFVVHTSLYKHGAFANGLHHSIVTQIYLSV